MKLLLITAIEEFEKNVKEILVHSGVSAFSYSPVKGYKSDEKQISLENWFASQISETDSLLFTAFVPEENVDKVYHYVEKFNQKQEFLSRIHLSTLNIEKSV